MLCLPIGKKTLYMAFLAIGKYSTLDVSPNTSSR